MARNIDTNLASKRRYRVARIDAWIRAGFIPDEANELSASGIKIRSPLYRRLVRTRRALLASIRASGIRDPGRIYALLDEFYLQREGDVWEFIREHYPSERAAA